MFFYRNIISTARYSVIFDYCIIMSTFSINEASKLSGLTSVMVDYLCRQKIVVPSFPRKPGRGKARRYSFGEVVLLKTIRKLLEKGVSVKRLKQAIRTKNKFFRDINEKNPPIHLFITDGREIFLRKPGDSLVNLTKNGQMEFSFIIDLRSTYSSVVDDLDKLPIRHRNSFGHQAQELKRSSDANR